MLPKEIVLPADVDAAAILTDYAVSGRYPDEVEEVSEEEYQEAVRLALVVVQWAESILPAPDTESEDPNSESH